MNACKFAARCSSDMLIYDLYRSQSSFRTCTGPTAVIRMGVVKRIRVEIEHILFAAQIMDGFDCIRFPNDISTHGCFNSV